MKKVYFLIISLVLICMPLFSIAATNTSINFFVSTAENDSQSIQIANLVESTKLLFSTDEQLGGIGISIKDEVLFSGAIRLDENGVFVNSNVLGENVLYFSFENIRTAIKNAVDNGKIKLNTTLSLEENTPFTMPHEQLKTLLPAFSGQFVYLETDLTIKFEYNPQITDKGEEKSIILRGMINEKEIFSIVANFVDTNAYVILSLQDNTFKIVAINTIDNGNSVWNLSLFSNEVDKPLAIAQENDKLVAGIKCVTTKGDITLFNGLEKVTLEESKQVLAMSVEAFNSFKNKTMFTAIPILTKIINAISITGADKVPVIE